MYRSVIVEGLGIPTVTLCSEGFQDDARSSASMSGMPDIRLIPNKIPSECTDTQKVADVIDGIFDDIISGLIRPLTDIEKSPVPPEDQKLGVVFKGDLYEVNRFFYKRGWTDGSPIFPPTKEAVAEMLTGTDLAPDYVVGKIVPRLGKATVEKIAINAVMAGALPTYIPLLIAGVEAIVDERAFLEWHGISVGSFAPVWIVNGPIRHDLNINSGTGLLSPGDMANTTFGRAMGLIIKNIGGIRKGKEDMGTFGNPFKYTAVVAEREEESPWEPLHVEFGFKKDDSTITVFQPHAYAPTMGSGDAKRVLTELVYDVMPEKSGLNLILLAPDTARVLFEEGFSKQEVSEYIYEYARIPAYRSTHMILAYQPPNTIKVKAHRGVFFPKFMPLNPMDPMRIFMTPECLKIVVAGGPHSGIGIFAGLKREENHDWVTKKVRFPANWDKLVKKYQGIIPTYAQY